MGKGLASVLATATVIATAIALVMLAAMPARGQTLPGTDDGPHRVVPVASLIDRLVHDGVGAPVAVVRDVVIVRDSGETLAVLEVFRHGGQAEQAGQGETPPVPQHVVAPLALLRLPADGGLRLIASAPPLAALPAIALPPTAVAQGLMVPPPDAGPLRVIAPSVPSQLAAQPR